MGLDQILQQEIKDTELWLSCVKEELLTNEISKKDRIDKLGS